MIYTGNMKTGEIHKLAIDLGIKADFRGQEEVQRFLDNKKKKFEKLSNKEDFDEEALENPYLDSRIYNISEDKEIKKVLNARMLA